MNPGPRGGAQVIGWDIGGAHVKACRVARGTDHGMPAVVVDIAEWACPLWQGLEALQRCLAEARERWPKLSHDHHAVTMTGEMADLFANRQEGVQQIAATMAAALGDSASLRFYRGPRAGGSAAHPARWSAADEVEAHWAGIASANWLATAQLAAQRVTGDALLIDIGSTTTDLIALRRAGVATRSRSDAERLATGELVYHGVVRTPLCAVAPQAMHRGTVYNVMNEFFATTADVYRLTGELDAAHDLHPAADAGAKDADGTRRRLARMIGLDAREASDEDWLTFARGWRESQLDLLLGEARRVLFEHRLTPAAPVIATGCGAFLAAEMARRLGRPCLHFASDIVPTGDAAQRRWLGVCAPAVAVALLAAQDAPALVSEARR